MGEYKRIIISRTDSIGDVILTLPLAGMIKKTLAGTHITFLGRSYTAAVVAACEHIDDFLNWDEISASDEETQIKAFRDSRADIIIHVFPVKEIASLARKAGIRQRLGTTNRWYHWLFCNNLVRLSRRRSSLHEAQLNIRLARSLTGIDIVPLDEMGTLYGLNRTGAPEKPFAQMIDPGRFNIILHPKSKGSAREWGPGNFKKLVEILPPDQYKIFVTGTAEEGNLLRESGLTDHPAVTDLCGRMSLNGLIAFIAASDGLVAASTGPLHLAAALGICAIGIYPPIRPMHPGRWAPLGPKAAYLAVDKTCNDCRKTMDCHCMREISPEAVKMLIEDHPCRQPETVETAGNIL